MILTRVENAHVYILNIFSNVETFMSMQWNMCMCAYKHVITPMDDIQVLSTDDTPLIMEPVPVLICVCNNSL